MERHAQLKWVVKLERRWTGGVTRCHDVRTFPLQERSSQLEASLLLMCTDIRDGAHISEAMAEYHVQLNVEALRRASRLSVKEDAYVTCHVMICAPVGGGPLAFL